MSAYELQTYQNGTWQYDSYYDDRDLVLSEAGRLDAAGKYMGVRVLEERFDEDAQIARYSTIFSRLKRVDQGTPAAKPRSPELSAGARAGGGQPGQKARPGSRQIKKKPKKKQKAGAFKMVALSLFLLLLGIGALFTLQFLSKM